MTKAKNLSAEDTDTTESATPQDTAKPIKTPKLECPKCSTSRKKVWCQTIATGMLYEFVCSRDECGFRMKGPPNVAVTDSMKRMLERNHEQHGVRDYQK